MESALTLSIPAAAGAQAVGCTDVMVGAGKEGCFFRLFYPCDPSAAQEARVPWLPRPEYLSALFAHWGWEDKAASYGASIKLGTSPLDCSIAACSRWRCGCLEKYYSALT